MNKLTIGEAHPLTAPEATSDEKIVEALSEVEVDDPYFEKLEPITNEDDMAEIAVLGACRRATFRSVKCQFKPRRARRIRSFKGFLGVLSGLRGKKWLRMEFSDRLLAEAKAKATIEVSSDPSVKNSLKDLGDRIVRRITDILSTPISRRGLLKKSVLAALPLALVACGINPGSLTPTVGPDGTATPKANSTETATPTATETPTPTETPTLPPEFESQMAGTKYNVNDNEVFFTPDNGQAIQIATVENGKFVFIVNSQEVSVDSKLAVVPEAKWFLNGASDQIMAINDATNTYWQYEFDQSTNQWVEKTLTEPSVDVNNPTKITFNDVISNRWATAVRQGIDTGKIPTFGPDVVISKMEYSPIFYKDYGWDAPNFSGKNPYGNAATRPIMYAAFGQIEVNGFVHEMATMQVAEQKGNYGLYNVLGLDDTYVNHKIKQDAINNKVWLMPVTMMQTGFEGTFNVKEPILSQWLYNMLTDLQPVTDDWVKNEVLEPSLARTMFMYYVASW